jgi:hypothetical protein
VHSKPGLVKGAIVIRSLRIDATDIEELHPAEFPNVEFNEELSTEQMAVSPTASLVG